MVQQRFVTVYNCNHLMVNNILTFQDCLLAINLSFFFLTVKNTCHNSPEPKSTSSLYLPNSAKPREQKKLQTLTLGKLKSLHMVVILNAYFVVIGFLMIDNESTNHFIANYCIVHSVFLTRFLFEIVLLKVSSSDQGKEKKIP